MNWYVQAFKKYADFNGRSRCSEFWYFTLVNALVIFGIILIELIFGTYGILGALFAFGTSVPALAVTVRRLHDTGRSGWNILLGLIPIVGGVIRAYLFATGQPGGRKSVWRVANRRGRG